MANVRSLDESMSLAEIWKNYLDLWIDPPEPVISWLNLFSNTDEDSSAIKFDNEGVETENPADVVPKSVKKHENVPRILLLKPIDDQEKELKDRFPKEYHLSSHDEMHQKSSECPQIILRILMKSCYLL